MRLRGKTAIVTGAGGTIGEAVARRFAEEGARVALIDRDVEAVASVADELGDAAFALTADVTKETDVARYAAAVADRFGAVDIFFNNAGIAGPVLPLASLTVDDFDAVMAVNVRGVFLGLKHVMPVMTDEGSVIVTSSIAGLRGSAGLGAYCASKHAVMGLVTTAAIEFAPRRIRVNAINPGPVDGRMMRGLEQGTKPSDPEAGRTAMTRQMRLGRYVDASEVADLVTFLTSDESRMITGRRMRSTPASRFRLVGSRVALSLMQGCVRKLADLPMPRFRRP